MGTLGKESIGHLPRERIVYPRRAGLPGCPSLPTTGRGIPPLVGPVPLTYATGTSVGRRVDTESSRTSSSRTDGGAGMGLTGSLRYRGFDWGYNSIVSHTVYKYPQSKTLADRVSGVTCRFSQVDHLPSDKGSRRTGQGGQWIGFRKGTLRTDRHFLFSSSSIESDPRRPKDRPDPPTSYPHPCL